MKTNDEKLKKDALVWIEDFGQMTDVQGDYVDCYVAGFKACEAMILTESVESLEKWCVDYFGDSDVCPIYLTHVKRASTTGAMSQAKRVRDAKIEGIKECIESLRSLGEQWHHERRWNHSASTGHAPVELSDYLIINVLRKALKQGGE